MTAGMSAEIPHGQSNKRCLNKKIKELGLKLRYPSFREGYELLIDQLCRN